MATAGGRRHLVYLSDPPLAPNGGEPQPRGQQHSVSGLTSAKDSGLWLLLLVAAFVIACIYHIFKKAEELETTGHGMGGGGGGGEDRRRARWQRQAAAAVLEVVVDVDKLGQPQVEPAALECTYRAAEGWEEGTCSVCLAEVQDGEAVRMLMPCTHYFHAACIDRCIHKSARHLPHLPRADLVIIE